MENDKIQLEPFSFVIERGKIKEFALAIGDENPIYYDIAAAKASGFRDVPIPPTFPTVVDMWGGYDFDTLIRILELDPLKVLHGEQEYHYYCSVCAGDILHASPKITGLIKKRKLEIYVLETEYRNGAGELVIHGTSKIIQMLI